MGLVALAPVSVPAARAEPTPAVFEVGDSLSVGMSPFLPARLVGDGWASAHIDAHGSRGVRTKVAGDPRTGLEAVADLRARFGDTPWWIVALGTNDAGLYPVTQYAAVIRQMLDAIGADHEVLWVNTYLPRSPARQAAWNAALDQVALERPDQLTVFDWASIAAQHAGILSADGVHPTGTGYSLMAAEVAAASQELLAGAVPSDVNVLGPAVHPSTVPIASGGLAAMSPARMLDTRGGQAVRAGEVVRVDLTGRVPEGSIAAAVNVTATRSSADGYLTVFPCDVPRPGTSAVNTVVGADASSLVVSGLDHGVLCVWSSVDTDLIVDVTGAFTENAGAGFAPAVPQRIADTRAGTRLGGGQVLTVDVPGGGVGALVNLTVARPAAGGYLTVYPCDQPRPATSNLNVSGGRSAKANAALVALSASGQLCVYSSVTADVVVDLMGRFAADGPLRFRPAVPVRLLDTRDGTGGWTGRLGRAQEITVTDASIGAPVLVGTITAVAPFREGYVTVWGTGERPPVSAVNVLAHETIANLAIVEPSGNGAFQLAVGDGFGEHLIFDITGAFVA